ncbi:MAG: DUF6174 domain-containing protein [Treponema sp.]|nr:DUF6174 domain-containing protein [Treponema sp.]
MKNSKIKPVLYSLSGKTAFILLCSLAFLNCRDLSVQQAIQFDQKTFNREWTAWEAQSLQNYTVRQKIKSWGPQGEVRIVVQGNVIVQKEALSKDDISEIEEHPNYMPWIFNEVKTISELYAMIDNIFNEWVERFKAEKNEQDGIKGIEFEITYNKKHHYPEYISLHRLYNKIPDGPTGITIYLSEFMPLTLE